MSISPSPTFDPVTTSPVPFPHTPPPSPDSPSDNVIKTVDLRGATFIVRGGSPEACPQIRTCKIHELTVADSKGEISIRYRPGSRVKAHVDRAVILGRRSSPSPYEDGDIDRPVRHLHRGEAAGANGPTGSVKNV